MSHENLPKGSLIFVTGGTGTVGGSIINEALKAGYAVKAAIRNLEKANYLRIAMHRRHGEDIRLEFVQVSDMTDSEAMKGAMKGCVAAAHTASDLSMGFDPSVVVTTSVNLTKAMLAAAAATPSIQRFVFTSSAAVLPFPSEEAHITPETWAPDSVVEEAWTEPYRAENMLNVYRASKIQAERACWDFVREKKPHFVLNTMVGMTQIGEFLDPRLASSMNGIFAQIWKGELQMLHILQSIGPNRLFNLQDSGLLHLAALTQGDVRGERLFGLGQIFDAKDVVDTMKKLDPKKELPQLEPAAEVRSTVDMSRTMELLARLGKPELTDLEDTIKQIVTTC